MFRFFLSFSLLWTLGSWAQVSGTVRDSESRAAIPYVNVWVEGEDLGATADENGKFQIEKSISGKKIVVSAVGYEQVSVSSDEFPSTIYLKPQTYNLPEVKVSKSKKIIRKIGKLKAKSGPTLHYTDEDDFDKPGLLARFFPYDASYRETPFLKIIRVKAGSVFFEGEKRHSQTFNIRLYTVGKDGAPGEFLYDKNIVVEVKKGYHNLAVDISKYRIDIPTDGFFVAVEWLLIDQNRHVRKHPLNGGTFERHYYGPDIEIYYNGEFTDSWIVRDGRWQRNPKALLDVQIELGN